MSEKNIYIGNTSLQIHEKQIDGTYVELEGERYYKITNYDEMPPFFMSIVSDSDHWMFLSSRGALTAGRINPDNALFPYYTDDRIHDSFDQTGSKTVVFITKGNKTYLWEPFSQLFAKLYSVERSILKNIYGNKIIFEEANLDLGITFRYSWQNSEKFGFIKQSTVINNNHTPVHVNILDGIQNILPYGLDRRFQLEYSTLADGYKKNELLPETGLALYRMSSIPTDKAEPSEALKVSTVWSVGAEKALKLISARQIETFQKGLPIEQENDIKAARGAYFMNHQFELSSGAKRDWIFAADINKDSSQVADLNAFLKMEKNLRESVLQDVRTGTDNLVKIVANSDGLQKTGDERACMRHFSNVLFNVMRGGIFDDNYQVTTADFITFIKNANSPLRTAKYDFLDSLPARIKYPELLKLCAAQQNPSLEKLCYEYMPLTFGRRHGDPSRPWNNFSIAIKNENGEKILNYQGNWRDIFQNWEALAPSFPEYVESMITKFVNASTADGYNPYRVTRDGFDWEKLDPNDPWSYIGYWGDHQIIYLLKLLELSAKYHPDRLESLLTKDIFAYANVPYRIKSYEQILADPHNTIEFDSELEGEIRTRIQKTGVDGKFIWDKNERIYHVNLAEKLLVTLLSKLSNFIPEAGIWMNTQRPEWNDANNALVGYGVSMVTLYYLRRYLNFCRDLFKRSRLERFAISAQVADLLLLIQNTLQEHQNVLSGQISDLDRKTILDELGSAGSVYRDAVYAGFSEEYADIDVQTIVYFCELVLKYIDHSIRANKRDDHLYHAYNLITIEENQISIRYLYEMLEGQVAVLSSGALSSAESLQILDALKQSSLYRKDQNSYILYPNRVLPRFLEKNTIPATFVESSELLQSMIRDGYKEIVTYDSSGHVHFNGVFRNARLLRTALENLNGSPYANLIQKEKRALLDVYEEMFDHQSFTGRSGTFYKYEGLGSIYWHMVSKLQLAVAENFKQAIDSNEDQTILKRLVSHYYDIREGIGVHKSPELYGAFPTDPYSHTPEFSGVQQPGMTGQVKEDILTRYMELGVNVVKGALHFSGDLIKNSEFLAAPETFSYYDVVGQKKQIVIKENCLAFTLCQVPVIYHRSDESFIELTLDDNSKISSKDLHLDQKTSDLIYNRTGDIREIHVYLTPGQS